MSKYFLILSLFCSSFCKAQAHSNGNEMEHKETNPLFCDIEKGVCAPAGAGGIDLSEAVAEEKPVKLVYFTDPICSFCWGIEPQLRKLKLEYGRYVDIEYHMGGLLPSWDGFNGGGISKPADVAHHWDEVSAYIDMPVDGNVWLEDPLPSSYPPSIAFKAAQMQDEEKAIVFLRRLREMVFLEKKNITRWEHIAAAAHDAELDTARLQEDIKGKAIQLFEADLQIAKQAGVRGFPTIHLVNDKKEKVVLSGYKPYKELSAAVLKLHPAAEKNTATLKPEDIFGRYRTLTTKEYAVIADLTKEKAEEVLQALAKQGKVVQHAGRNGSLWKWTG